MAKASRRVLGIFKQVTVYQCLEQFVPVNLTNHAAGIIVIGDIGGILCQQVANDLVNGVITLFVQSVEHITENSAHIVFIIAGHSKLDGISGIVHYGNDLLPIVSVIIAQYSLGVKTQS